MITPPAGSHPCRVCAAAVPAGAARCGQCGAAQVDLGPCPLCGGQGGSSPDPELRFACDLCGGPRVPWLDTSIQPSGLDAPLLRKADAARKARAAWRGTAFAAGIAFVLAVVPFVLLLAVIGAKLFVLVPGLLFTGLFGGMLAMAIGRARSRGAEIAPALDGAWLAAATAIARQVPGPIGAADLSKRLGIEEPQAEELLALLDVNGVSTDATAAPRVRIASAPGAPPPEALAAEQEALADAETAAEAERKKL
jgi:hypothetical protein